MIPAVPRSCAQRVGFVFAAALAAASLLACVSRDRMCAVDDPCSQGHTCVSGRCVSAKGAVRLFEVDDAGSPVVKRRIFPATEVGWIPGKAPSEEGKAGSVPEVIGLGGASRGVLLLRFAEVVVPPDLVEAYVLLRRAAGTDPPTGPVVLGAHRIEEDWDPVRLVHSRPPRWTDVLGPETRILPVSGDVVRIDVRSLVAGWTKKRLDDQGIAILAHESATPLYLALLPARGTAQGPVLELYAR